MLYTFMSATSNNAKGMQHTGDMCLVYSIVLWWHTDEFNFDFWEY